MKVLYITGWTRSGSTLLGNVLGELPGVAHVGELHYLWRNGALTSGTNSQCGCGEPLRTCALWGPVISEHAGSGDARVMEQRQATYLRTRHTWRRLTESCGPATVPDEVADTVDRTVAVYDAVRRAGHGQRLVVDGSKYPAEAAALLGHPDVDAKVLHIVRDPRGTAASYKSAKDYIDPMGPATSSAYWSAFNTASELIGRAAPGRFLQLRHEDVCADPAAVLRQVLDFVGLRDDVPVQGERQVTLHTNHTVTGNPDRLRTGAVTIRRDDRWRDVLSRAELIRATVPGAALMLRYGYPLRPGSSRDGAAEAA